MEHHFVLKLKYLVETYNNLTSGKLMMASEIGQMSDQGRNSPVMLIFTVLYIFIYTISLILLFPFFHVSYLKMDRICRTRKDLVLGVKHY